MATSQSEKATRFQALHQAPGAFVIPNPWDAGSARVLAERAPTDRPRWTLKEAPRARQMLESIRDKK